MPLGNSIAHSSCVDDASRMVREKSRGKADACRWFCFKYFKFSTIIRLIGPTSRSYHSSVALGLPLVDETMRRVVDEAPPTTVSVRSVSPCNAGGILRMDPDDVRTTRLKTRYDVKVTLSMTRDRCTSEHDDSRSNGSTRRGRTRIADSVAGSCGSHSRIKFSGASSWLAAGTAAASGSSTHSFASPNSLDVGHAVRRNSRTYLSNADPPEKGTSYTPGVTKISRPKTGGVWRSRGMAGQLKLLQGRDCCVGPAGHASDVVVQSFDRHTDLRVCSSPSAGLQYESAEQGSHSECNMLGDVTSARPSTNDASTDRHGAIAFTDGSACEKMAT
mmetsp:Transcript_7586/g.24275  ORF Transcript_7586/g.24275 Transcript_7586/m.24275 type:complete len:331 (+) Transcript_7586:342-1334(+)